MESFTKCSDYLIHRGLQAQLGQLVLQDQGEIPVNWWVNPGIGPIRLIWPQFALLRPVQEIVMYWFSSEGTDADSFLFDLVFLWLVCLYVCVCVFVCEYD